MGRTGVDLADQIRNVGGTIINPGTEEKQDQIILGTDELIPRIGTPITFEDTNFFVGDSPAILDLNTALGRNATEFSVLNGGAGMFTVSISNDGAVFGNEHTMKNGEDFSIDRISVDSIRITHVSDSSYRVIAL